MLLEKLLFKLKKRQKHQAITKITDTYMSLSTPTINTIDLLTKYAHPNKLYQWLGKHKDNLSNSNYSKFLAIITASDQEKLTTPKKQLKIAVCISGEPRTFEHCISSFHRFFHGHKIDIFIANKSHATSSIIRENYSPKYLLEYSDNDFNELEIKGIKSFGFLHLKHNVTIPVANTNIYPMWFGIQKSFHALKENTLNIKKYDAICRCRFDTFFRKQLELESFSKSTVFIDPNYNEHGGYSDQFAIGNPESMEQYFNLYDWFPKSFSYDFGKKGFLPERILKEYLENVCKLKVINHDFETRLLRHEFTSLKSHEIPIKSNLTNLARNKNIQEYIKLKFPELYSKQ
ncbi:hypothetical protein ACU6U9_04785 [Pseudomonas sp. HK3]